MSIEFQLYPKGNVYTFMELFCATKEHLEQAAGTAIVARSYVMGYMRAGRLQRGGMALHSTMPPRDNVDFDDLPPLSGIDNMEEVD